MSDDIPPALKQALVKPLSREVRKWTKAVRRPVEFGGPSGGGGGGATDDEGVKEGAFTQGPLKAFLTQLVQKKKKGRGAEGPPATPAAAGPAPAEAKKLEQTAFCRRCFVGTFVYGTRGGPSRGRVQIQSKKVRGRQRSTGTR